MARLWGATVGRGSSRSLSQLIEYLGVGRGAPKVRVMLQAPWDRREGVPGVQLFGGECYHMEACWQRGCGISRSHRLIVVLVCQYETIEKVTLVMPASFLPIMARA